MDGKYKVAIALMVMGAALVAGCTEEIKEALDPKLDLKVLQVKTMSTPPPPENDTLENGMEYLYILVNITNRNEKTDKEVFPGWFTVDDNKTAQVQAVFIVNRDTGRSIGRVLVDHGTSRTVWAVFKVPTDKDFKFLRFQGTMDEPIEVGLIPYAHQK